MKALCECSSLRCTEVIELPIEELQKIITSGSTIIAEGCEHGPDSTDTLISKKCGYSIYQEQTDG